MNLAVVAPGSEMNTSLPFYQPQGNECDLFEAAFRRYLNEAYTWDLWGAADVIHGGCSDDGFEYFRRWLVSTCSRPCARSSRRRSSCLATSPWGCSPSKPNAIRKFTCWAEGQQDSPQDGKPAGLTANRPPVSKTSAG